MRRLLPPEARRFPESILRKVKTGNPRTGRKDLLKYRDVDRNQLANCILLSRKENGAGGKSDTPDKWFADKGDVYLDMHLIPKDDRLWVLDRFEDFIAERKKLIRENFAHLLVQPKVGGAPAIGK